MASPCQLLIETQDETLARHLAQIAIDEVARIERKFSRYRNDNLCHAINNANGQRIPIDEECHRLLTFADTCFDLSEGMFDLSSGVLRRVWRFDCSDNIPTQEQIEQVLPLIGWNKITFDQDVIQLQAGMEIDFGGIGKEYAVSAVSALCQQQAPETSVLINLGGDIQITRARKSEAPWYVGIENHDKIIPIVRGALATSGDAKRYVQKGKVRYSHILNPKTGWPVSGAPSSVTTHASLCIQAGCLATIALLHGRHAEQFLQEQDVDYWCTRI